MAGDRHPRIAASHGLIDPEGLHRRGGPGQGRRLEAGIHADVERDPAQFSPVAATDDGPDLGRHRCTGGGETGAPDAARAAPLRLRAPRLGAVDDRTPDREQRGVFGEAVLPAQGRREEDPIAGRGPDAAAGVLDGHGPERISQVVSSRFQVSIRCVWALIRRS